ncbi:hypothetical protein BZA05DRAFT_44155 [Tricharina praecox]|uniref:uncharacterized protein n=1 Tax=Tricharina praecox TaxID=43433 RepID=UPI00221EB866|nr:uncharacterized protein BZA05DRAFT_44155 [Tricharina praecox]KAI5851810.1 hypothetical protein BZA05DRAFT_44155 [Tricharina praecox]
MSPDEQDRATRRRGMGNRGWMGGVQRGRWIEGSRVYRLFTSLLRLLLLLLLLRLLRLSIRTMTVTEGESKGVEEPPLQKPADRRHCGNDLGLREGTGVEEWGGGRGARWKGEKRRSDDLSQAVRVARLCRSRPCLFRYLCSASSSPPSVLGGLFWFDQVEETYRHAENTAKLQRFLQ